MPDSPGTAHTLHVLVSRLDREADRILRADLGLTYSRFLTLLMVGQHEPATQRRVAEALGVTEPAVSRTLTALAADGVVTVARAAGAGNRRVVTLTPAGRRLVDRAATRLEGAFAALTDLAEVDRALLDRQARALADVLGAG